jgi:putative membrane protein
MRWMLRLLLNSLLLIVVAGYFEDFHLSSVSAAIIASILLSILNTIVKPILILLTLPVTILSLGLFLIVINAITLMMTQAIMGDSFVIDHFSTAILAAIVISILNLLIENIVVKPLTKKDKHR